jgi:WD40 repeat protein/serine/threonine protein kinase
MTLASVTDLVQLLCAHQLLEPEHLAALGRLQSQFREPRSLARELIQRGWLTPYQANQIFLGKTADLVLGQYVLLERLGEGAMGQVFKARHLKMGRIVALKQIRKDRLANPTAVQRFQREIQLVAALHHPNIVLGFDADEVAGHHFFTMEYVEGISLSQWVKRYGPMPVWQACDHIRQAALGLQHAFERGLVHRDIKPGNLFLVPLAPAFGDNGAAAAIGTHHIVKILDLGLARFDGDELVSPGLTQVNTLLGTPDYVSPEQARDSRAADIRSDLYSLGCTFYYLLAGKAPFSGETKMDKVLKHLMEEPPAVEQIRRRQLAERRQAGAAVAVPQGPDDEEVPDAVVAVLRKLMAKRPQDRYQTPAELSADLAALMPSGTPVAPEPVTDRVWPTTSRGRASPMPTRLPLRWLLVSGAAALVLVLVGTVFALLVSSGGGPASTGSGARGEPTASGLKAIAARIKDPTESSDTLRQELLAFQLANAGTSAALEAADLMERLPSPLDHFAADQIPGTERLPGEPPERVAVLGSHRSRHWGPVRAVAYSPDGQLVASGGRDGAIRLWATATGNVRTVLHGHTGEVLSLAFSADGDWLVSGSADTTVMLWELSKGTEKVRLQEHQGPVVGVLFSPDGKTIASRSEDKTVKLWSAVTGKVQHTMRNVPNRNASLAFSPDSKTLLWGIGDEDAGAVQVVEVATGEMRPPYTGLPHPVLALAHAPDAPRLAVGCRDGSIRLLDADGKERKALSGQRGAVVSLAFSPDGKTLASASAEGPRVKLWNVETGKERANLDSGAYRAFSVAYSPDGSSVAAGDEEGALHLWDATTGKPLTLFQRHVVHGGGVAFSPDSKTLVQVTGRNQLQWWDLTREQQLPVRPASVNALAFAPKGDLLALASGTSVKLWDARANKESATVPSPREAAVTSVAIGAKGQLLISGSRDKTVRLWDLAKSSERATLSGHTAAVRAVAIAPSGKFIASAADDKTVRVWELTDDAGGIKERRTFMGHTSAVTTVTFTPDSKRVVSGGNDGTVRLWDMVEGSVRLAASEHTGGVAQVAFSPDGKTLATTGYDGRVVLWEPGTLQPRQTWQLPGPVRGLSFAPDGRHLATANADDTVTILRYGAMP